MITNIEYSIENNKNQFNDDKLSFHINNTNDNLQVSFVNSIRRTIEEHMYSYVLSEINIVENNTIFNNDILIQRLTMMPIIFDKADNYELDKILIKLDISNESTIPITIKAKHLQFLYENKEIENLISYPDIIFVQNIIPGQHIKFICNLHKGESNVHASYKHTCKNIYHFKMNDELINLQIKEQNITDERDKIDFRLSNQIYKKSKNGLPLIYIYEMESNGVMSVKKTLVLGIKYLIIKLNTLMDMIQTNIHEFSEDNPVISVFLFKNETHTLGNLLSQYISSNKLLESCTYLIPHPLDNILLLKLYFKEEKNNTKDISIKIINETCFELIKLYEEFLKYFE